MLEMLGGELPGQSRDLSVQPVSYVDDLWCWRAEDLNVIVLPGGNSLDLDGLTVASPPPTGSCICGSSICISPPSPAVLVSCIAWMGKASLRYLSSKKQTRQAGIRYTKSRCCSQTSHCISNGSPLVVEARALDISRRISLSVAGATNPQPRVWKVVHKTFGMSWHGWDGVGVVLHRRQGHQPTVREGDFSGETGCKANIAGGGIGSDDGGVILVRGLCTVSCTCQGKAGGMR